jgi:hypothetical protein
MARAGITRFMSTQRCQKRFVDAPSPENLMDLSFADDNVSSAGSF